MAEPDNGNGRVTLAVLSTKLDTVLARLEDFCDQQKTDHEDIAKLKTGQAELSGRIDRVNDRVSGWQVVGSGVSAVLAALAAAVVKVLK